VTSAFVQFVILNGAEVSVSFQSHKFPVPLCHWYLEPRFWKIKLNHKTDAVSYVMPRLR